MKSRIAQFASCCVLLFSFGQSLAQASKTLLPFILEDPAFGLAYNPHLVKYEQVPLSFKKQCPDFFNDKKESVWLYAHLKYGKSDYYIVMSTSPDQDGDSFGTAVWFDGSKCRMDEAKWTLSGVIPRDGYKGTGDLEKMPGLDMPTPSACNSDPSAPCYYTLQSARQQEILSSLIRDAIQRAIKAYGGDAPFRKKACTTKVLNDNLSYPIVKRELQAYCSKNPN